MANKSKSQQQFLVINLFDLSLNKPHLVVKHLCCQSIFLIKIQNNSEVELLDTNFPINHIVLEENFCFKNKIRIEFFLIVNNITMYNNVKQFQEYTKDTIKYLNHIYYYYSCFVNLINKSTYLKKILF